MKAFSQPLWDWIYIGALLLGFVSLGWLLAAFQVPWIVWLGAGGMILHLLKAEADAIALSNAWIVVIISSGAVLKAWAPIISPNLPYENAKAWALGLLLIWLWVSILAVGLGFSKKPMQGIGMRRSLYQLLLLEGALGCGWLIERMIHA
jgi:hypothetical protein